MKKTALFLIILAIIGRVISCGQKVDLSAQTNQLSRQVTDLNSEIDNLLTQNAQANSVTSLTDSGNNYHEIKLTQHIVNNLLTIAQSQ